MSQTYSSLFIIFGGTGDLAYRKLYPALYNLYRLGLLQENFAIIGTARREWSDQYFQEVVVDSIDEVKESDEHAQKFASHFRYQSHDITNTENYQTLKKLADKLDEEYEIKGNRVYYLSVSPRFFGTVASHLKSQNLITDNGFNHLVIEKPFGSNFENSNELNNEILASFDEKQIYRIDHYLGKEMLQNLLTLRLENTLIKKLWNADFISNMQITLAEEIGVEDRGTYYDDTGALRDMVQNHILQIVSMLYMDIPEIFNSNKLSENKIRVLKELKPISDKNITECFVRGQYTSNPSYPSLLSYRSENEVDEVSTTETYVAGKIESTNEKWVDVPIYIRTGKRMKEKVTRVDIVFKNGTPSLFNEEATKQNVLSILIAPEEGIALELNNKQIGYQFDTEPVTLNYTASKDAPDDYEKLLLNILQGDKTNFVHWEEVAYSWKYIDKICAAWPKDATDLVQYPVLTNGPKEANDLLTKGYHYWIYK